MGRRSARARRRPRRSRATRSPRTPSASRICGQQGNDQRRQDRADRRPRVEDAVAQAAVGRRQDPSRHPQSARPVERLADPEHGAEHHAARPGSARTPPPSPPPTTTPPPPRTSSARPSGRRGSPPAPGTPHRSTEKAASTQPKSTLWRWNSALICGPTSDDRLPVHVVQHGRREHQPADPPGPGGGFRRRGRQDGRRRRDLVCWKLILCQRKPPPRSQLWIVSKAADSLSPHAPARPTQTARIGQDPQRARRRGRRLVAETSPGIARPL